MSEEERREPLDRRETSVVEVEEPLGPSSRRRQEYLERRTGEGGVVEVGIRVGSLNVG